MKLLLENWRKYLEEEDNLEQSLYSFDFDNTLIRYHTLEDGDVEYLGPHEENIQLVKDLAAEGNKVIIVTSRCKLKGPKREWDTAPTPEEGIQQFGLPIEEVYYTSGNFKASKLVELGVVKHWDDDEDEVAEAQTAGIEAVLVPTEEGITDRLRDQFISCVADEEKLSENKTVFYVNINDVLPTEELGHGKDHDCPSAACDDVVNKKMLDIESGQFEPIEVCNQKPVKTYRAQGEKVGRASKSGISEPFYHVMNGHHRLEAARKLGLGRVPVYITPEEN